MKPLGRHLIMEFYECDVAVLDDSEAVEKIMLRAAEAAGATVVTHACHHFSPHGVSAVVAIGESHLSIHTWPEYGYCAADIFTCGESTDNGAALEVIREAFSAGGHKALEVQRGLLSRRDVEVRHKPA
ncbi:MAG: adenosylmethionine decarboxylase [Candidatus Latescibacteria bacterium]|jgi:S-adenosylmethionine decarboxylase proenzyme|nr:adenosylmethionine decarboxylase [Candidatus Latescibacterota bacterium]